MTQKFPSVISSAFRATNVESLIILRSHRDVPAACFLVYPRGHRPCLTMKQATLAGNVIPAARGTNYALHEPEFVVAVVEFTGLAPIGKLSAAAAMQR